MADTNHLEGLNRLRALLNPEDLHQLVDSTRRASIVGWGTLFSVVYYVDGIVKLHKVGSCFAAGPLRRSAMEYGMWTVWLADMGDDAVDVINIGLQNTNKNLIKGLEDAGRVTGDLAPAVQVAKTTQVTPLPKHPGETYLSFKNLLDDYDPAKKGDGTWPYRLMYNVESRFVHASMTGAQIFFEADPDRDDLVFWKEPRFQEVIPCVECGLGLLHMTMLAYNELLIGKPWTNELSSCRCQDFC